jgi:hypothetical protein
VRKRVQVAGLFFERSRKKKDGLFLRSNSARRLKNPLLGIQVFPVDFVLSTARG